MNPARPRLGSPAALAGYAALLLGMLTVGAASQQRSAVAGLWISEAFAIALPALAAVGLAGLRPGEFLGLRRVGWRWLVAAAALALCDQPIVSFLTWASREMLPAVWASDFDAKQRLLESLFAGHAAALAVTVVTAAPLGEELFFRGFAFAALARSRAWTAAASIGVGLAVALFLHPESADKAVLEGILAGMATATVLHFALRAGPAARPWGALLASSALFSALHFDAVGFAGLFQIGLLCAALRWASGSLWPAMVAHAVNNGVAAGAFALGYETPDVPPPPWLLALGAALLVGAAVLLAVVARKPSPAAPREERAARRSPLAAILAAFWGLAVIAGGAALVLARR